MNPPTTHIHIVDGVARTINQNVKVKMIASAYLDAGQSFPAIAEHYSISLADVHAALAYYYDNLAAFEANERRNQALLEQYAVSSEEVLTKMRTRAPESK
jgi:uncharacterized protein (DUF433 family)